jgi:5'-phosphate synthase pdxT subunit
MVNPVRARVGILGFQGCIEPHERILNALGAETVRVRTREDLNSVERLILPGGESTTMLRFLKLYDLISQIQEFAKTHPVWGICAGAILAAREVHNPSQESLNLIDISAHRNFYGSQLDSFSVPLSVQGLHKPIVAQFIRAPLLNELPQSANSEPVQIMAKLEQQPVFLAQGKTWVSSFHVELGEDPSLHELFLKL